MYDILDPDEEDLCLIFSPDQPSESLMNPILTVTDITITFQDVPALDKVSFQLKEGEILAVLGPSGSGKTTLLEIIAGLQEPDQGHCLWAGKPLDRVPAFQRGFGLMFQDFALFPHKNIAENVSFGLEMKGWPREKIQERVDQVLDLVGLSGFRSRSIETLSGGEKQRVALARSLAPQPQLLMLDEPLGSLDRTLRERLLEELGDILREINQTAIYVTHDQVEAFLIADRVLVLNAGTTAQVGTPEEIYQQPNSPFIARFLGLSNLIEGKAKISGRGSLVSSPLGEWILTDRIEGKVTLLLRPDRINTGPAPEDHYVQLQGVLTKSSFSGQLYKTEIKIKRDLYRFDFPASTTSLPEIGETITLHFDPHQAVQLLDR
ncbi:MAG: ABC transporter ATP-binding protein [Anaerolineales bacterium]|nr:ABC transporter ATP-binding protein [Anaerolineales bacterium]